MIKKVIDKAKEFIPENVSSEQAGLIKKGVIGALVLVIVVVVVAQLKPSREEPAEQSEGEAQPVANVSRPVEFIGLSLGESLDDILNSSESIEKIETDMFRYSFSRLLDRDLGLTSRGHGPEYRELVLPDGVREGWTRMMGLMHGESLGYPDVRRVVLVNREHEDVFSSIDAYFFNDRAIAFDLKSRGGFVGEEIVDRWLERFDGSFLGQARIRHIPSATPTALSKIGPFVWSKTGPFMKSAEFFFSK